MYLACNIQAESLHRAGLDAPESYNLEFMINNLTGNKRLTVSILLLQLDFNPVVAEISHSIMQQPLQVDGSIVVQCKCHSLEFLRLFQL